MTKMFLALLLAAPFFLWHLLSVILVITPENPFTEKIRPVAFAYTEALFPQHWEFFAPDPPLSNSYFLYRCKLQEHGWGPWFDPGTKLRYHHKRNRLSHHGKLLFIYYEMIRKLEARFDGIASEIPCRPGDESCMPKVNDLFTKTEEYKLAGRFASGLCKKKHADSKGTLEKVEFKTLTKAIPDFKQRMDATANANIPVTSSGYPPLAVAP